MFLGPVTWFCSVEMLNISQQTAESRREHGPFELNSHVEITLLCTALVAVTTPFILETFAYRSLGSEFDLSCVCLLYLNNC